MYKKNDTTGPIVWFSIWKSISVIHHINQKRLTELKKKNPIALSDISTDFWQRGKDISTEKGRFLQQMLLE